MNPSLSTLQPNHYIDSTLGHALDTSDAGAMSHGMTGEALDFNDLA
jgi:hypothetical protein